MPVPRVPAGERVQRAWKGDHGNCQVWTDDLTTMRLIRTSRGAYRCCLIDVQRDDHSSGAPFVAYVRRVTLHTSEGEVELSVDGIRPVRAQTWQEAIDQAERAFEDWVWRHGWPPGPIS